MIDADRCSVNSDIAERESIAEQRAFVWMNLFREQVSAYKHYKRITIRAFFIKECFCNTYVAIFPLNYVTHTMDIRLT